MSYISEIKIDGFDAMGFTPVVAGFSPTITWLFQGDAASNNQVSVEIKISTSSVDLGTPFFNGIILDETINSSSNFYIYSNTNLSRGTTYYGQIRITDENSNLTDFAKFSYSVNSLPVLTSYYINPTNPTAADDLELVYNYFDSDGDVEDGTKIIWLKNNIPAVDYNNLCVLPKEATSPQDSWTARIIPSDGLEFGIRYETEAVIISSSSGSILSCTIEPTDGNIDDIFKVTYEIDTDEYSSPDITIEWYINNILVPDSNQEYIRLELIAGDAVYCKIKTTENNVTISELDSNEVVVSDSVWTIDNIQIDGQSESPIVYSTKPNFKWNVYKSNSVFSSKPNYTQIKITKTQSLDGAIFDSGIISYFKDNYSLTTSLEIGNKYYVHIAVSDSNTIDDDQFVTKEFSIYGSSWENSVDNSLGWTIELQLALDDSEVTSNMGLYVHDGSYFCSLIFGLRYITLVSTQSVTYNFPISIPSLSNFKSFKISAKNRDIKIFMDNKLVINSEEFIDNVSQLKLLEFGDIDPQKVNSCTIKYIRYSTNGAYGFGDNLPDENTFYFTKIGQIEGGSIDCIFENLLAWTPDDGSSKLIKYNTDYSSKRYKTAPKNLSPITTIKIDKNRNKYIGTSNGVVAIHGEKHDPDFYYNTSDGLSVSDFDRISTVDSEFLSGVESQPITGWFTIDTTYRSLDTDEYIGETSAIHYLTQRTHGHPWYDNCDNSKGWQISFGFELEELEADDLETQNLSEKNGFGFYFNDGKYQEIIYFYKDKIRLYYANVFVTIDTTLQRDYVVRAKNNNIYIYQKRTDQNVPYSLLIDGSGLFTTTSSISGNSSKPKIYYDSNGIYHSVWHDDSSQRNQILYSYFDGSSWSVPQVVSVSKFSLSNPNLISSSDGKIWVVYEDLSFGQSEISVSVLDRQGWNSKTRLTNYKSEKQNPAITIDNNDDIHVVWSDNRNGNFEIFWCKWDNNKKAWISSNQYGDDTSVMSYESSDPYQNNQQVNFYNPNLDVIDDSVVLVAECKTGENKSMIFAGVHNTVSKTWNSSGAILLDDDGNFINTGTSILVSDSDRNCVRPDVSVNSLLGRIIFVWQDDLMPTSQIWGSSLNRTFNVVTPPTQITEQLDDCLNPSCGWNQTSCIIPFEYDSKIYISYYDYLSDSFIGSATGGEDRLIVNSDIFASNPHISKFVSSRDTKIIYDFANSRDPYTVSSIEFPDFQLIQERSVELNSDFDILSTNTVSDLDTKEFAFGDFSENVGIKAHFKNIGMYFGYDAKPYSIVKYNSSTIQGWPNNKINDLFVDVFGNIISATYNGVAYMNISNGKVLTIRGNTIDYSSEDGCTTDTCILNNKLTTSVTWGKNGIWYVGTTDGLYFSTSAGRYWSKLFPEIINSTIYHISTDKTGRSIVSSGSGLYVAHPDMTNPIIIDLQKKVKVAKIDEQDIIWAGTDSGLYRIENFSSSNLIVFTKNNGLKSAQINDISIVNKNLRYLATPAGISKMFGTNFGNINSKHYSIINDNISSLQYDETTNSLWVSSLYKLYEIVFRDPYHEIIEDETVSYDNGDLGNDVLYEKNNYITLDYGDAINEKIIKESVSVYINKNKLDFGYVVSDYGDAIYFLCNLLPEDEVELEISNKFQEVHDFKQIDIEKEVKGLLNTNITKMDRTSRNQLLLLSQGDKKSILLDGGQHSLPFTTLMVDREAPVGCIQKITDVSKNIIKFKIIATDDVSGINGMIVSNYSNFTSDGANALPYSAYSSFVNHDIGTDLNVVTDDLVFEDVITINNNDYNIGNGKKITKWFDESSNKEYLYSVTSKPVIIYRYDPEEDEWNYRSNINISDPNIEITELKTINNIIWLTTGKSGSYGTVYKSVDGSNFTAIGNVTGEFVRGISNSNDGLVLFGSSDGKIYSYKDNVFSTKYQNVSQSIYSLEVFDDELLITTGTKGRIYSYDLSTGNSTIIYDGADTYLSNIIVKDKETTTDKKNAIVFASSGTYTNIYKANLYDKIFIKSYSNYNKIINVLHQVDNSFITDPSITPPEGTTILAAIGDTLYKYSNNSWLYMYKHSETINDIIDYYNNGRGIYIISNSKITKWTAQKNTKFVYLKLTDKAGNETPVPLTENEYLCPTATNSICCNYAYSININDLQNFVNESKIIQISEYGEILFSYNSNSDKSIYSADLIDEEIGIYTSEIFNGSNDLIGWKSITWESTEPTGTSVDVQIRSGTSESGTSSNEWSDVLEKNSSGIAPIEYITDQYIQFKITLKSRVRDISPSLTSVTIRNIVGESSHFFTTNFILPSKPIKGLLTSNTFIPVSADIVFGINTNNSVDFSDYQIIETDRLFTTNLNQKGSNLRIGAKLLTPSIPQIVASNDPYDPYDSSSYVCTISFDFTNSSGSSHNYHFRVKFYSDIYRTQLVNTFFTGNDQTGWSIDGGTLNVFPPTGTPISNGSSKLIEFEPGNLVSGSDKLYITIDSYNGTNFTTFSDDRSFICPTCNVINESGLVAEYYKTGLPLLNQLPDFSNYIADYVLVDDNINFGPISSDWVTSRGQTLSNYIDNFAIRWRGKILISSEGTYNFQLTSDDGSKLFIDFEEIINHDGLHGTTSKEGSVFLNEGYHNIEIQYFENLYDAEMKLLWKQPNDPEFSIIPDDVFFHSSVSEYCDDSSNIPKIFNLAVIFELENGEHVKLNLE